MTAGAGNLVLASLLPLSLLATSPTTTPQPLGDDEVEVYFGAGCFWHVQAELNEAEEDVLGRSGASITGITGYAGGFDNSGEVCYTNYGKKGHTEVVQLRLPRRHVAAIATFVWQDLFSRGERTDTANRGAPYRSAIGLPGGAAGDPRLLEAIDAAQGTREVKLVPGSGDDGDNLGTRSIYVYDSNKFPFHQAELYHQFHDYKGSYRKDLLAAGRLRETSCPSETMAMLSHPVVLVLLSIIGAGMFCCCFGVAYKRLKTIWKQ
eukprot:CAMPEP_0197911476 /NCGR_PEP_ID=MMETSP1439-20131203/72887_1 /TAXON_ID=66791 /ORGANISM="Gonyaulax spinifera, Strain CCMP409" /LENGTH=262 /DNA_ID=CAMNT_0043533205 /DNA_START=41 /DNA_END=829 /DNA_ORIENTATION=-